MSAIHPGAVRSGSPTACACGPAVMPSAKITNPTTRQTIAVPRRPGRGGIQRGTGSTRSAFGSRSLTSFPTREPRRGFGPIDFVIDCRRAAWRGRARSAAERFHERDQLSVELVGTIEVASVPRILQQQLAAALQARDEIIRLRWREGAVVGARD